VTSQPRLFLHCKQCCKLRNGVVLILEWGVCCPPVLWLCRDSLTLQVWIGGSFPECTLLSVWQRLQETLGFWAARQSLCTWLKRVTCVSLVPLKRDWPSPSTPNTQMLSYLSPLQPQARATELSMKTSSGEDLCPALSWTRAASSGSMSVFPAWRQGVCQHRITYSSRRVREDTRREECMYIGTQVAPLELGPSALHWHCATCNRALQIPGGKSVRRLWAKAKGQSLGFLWPPCPVAPSLLALLRVALGSLPPWRDFGGGGVTLRPALPALLSHSWPCQGLRTASLSAWLPSTQGTQLSNPRAKHIIGSEAKVQRIHRWQSCTAGSIWRGYLGKKIWTCTHRKMWSLEIVIVGKHKMIFLFSSFLRFWKDNYVLGIIKDRARA
jgi:hypothetical protein